MLSPNFSVYVCALSPVCSWVAMFRVMIVLFKDIEPALIGQDLNGTVRTLKSFQAYRMATVSEF